MKKRTKSKVSFVDRVTQSKQAKIAAEWKKLDVLYEFDMEFEIEHVNKIIQDFAEENNLADDDFVPEYVVIDAYEEQDLIIALKMMNIKAPEFWEIGIDSHFYSEEKDDVLTIPFSLDVPAMSHAELMAGCEVKVNRGAGIKTRWKGLQAEMIDNWKDQGIPEGYELIKSQVYIKAQAHFNNYQAYKDHHDLLFLRDNGRLVNYLKVKHVAGNRIREMEDSFGMSIRRLESMGAVA